jgi:hypothetical protein
VTALTAPRADAPTALSSGMRTPTGRAGRSIGHGNHISIDEEWRSK